MHVLITPVGHQDPLSGNTYETGSVLTLVRHLQIDRVFLLPTRHPSGERKNEQGEDLDTYDKAVWTRQELLGEEYRLSEQAVTILPLDVENPTDYAQVLEALEKVARRIKAELADVADEVTFHISAASGTPTIKASMMAPLLETTGRLKREIPVGLLTLLFANLRAVEVPPTRQCPARKRMGKPILSTPATDPRHPPRNSRRRRGRMHCLIPKRCHHVLMKALA